MNLNNKKVVVIGAGKSGISAARLLNEEHARIYLYDVNENLNREELAKKLGADYSGEIVLGAFPEELEREAELVIISPGVPADLDFVCRLRNNNVPIWGEVELAYRFAKGRLIAVTGTNGKTTTTALTGEIMKLFFEKVFVVGNIGTPYTDFAKQVTEESVTVAEMSSFQLESIEEFHPCVSMILNITPDHLNRHHTMEAYTEAKFNIAKKQTPGEICILNYEDERLRASAEKLHTKIFWFSSTRILRRGLYLKGDNIVYNDGTAEETVISVQELNIIGRHNYENAMAAIAAGISMRVPMDLIREALRNFVAVEHRIEYTATKRGVLYYNDSKGTNPDASIQAVKAMTRPTFLIGGGYDKGSTYEEWIASFENKIKALILMGQTADKIEETARRMGFRNIVRVGSMEEAVQYCYDNAADGDAVLLSPCCASWGMFKNYEERGEIFKNLVRALPE